MIKKRVLRSFFFAFVATTVCLIPFFLSKYDTLNILYVFSFDKHDLFDFYSVNLRGNFFGGFLGLGGFLLSLKTFIIVNMKDKLYSNEKYIKKWKNSTTIKDSLLHPLRELSDILYFAILMSIISAVAQITIGFIESNISILICIYFASVTIVLLIDSLHLIRKNLNILFDYDDQNKT